MLRGKTLCLCFQFRGKTYASVYTLLSAPWQDAVPLCTLLSALLLRSCERGFLLCRAPDAKERDRRNAAA